ncbi:hypothetical protein EPO04_02080 [Patescibacteria group bacterium]|nr:MAG: hypothetical protein EPO04_02080 [Patescibacteria group bacterium]
MYNHSFIVAALGLNSIHPLELDREGALEVLCQLRHRALRRQSDFHFRRDRGVVVWNKYEFVVPEDQNGPVSAASVEEIEVAFFNYLQDLMRVLGIRHPVYQGKREEVAKALFSVSDGELRAQIRSWRRQCRPRQDAPRSARPDQAKRAGRPAGKEEPIVALTVQDLGDPPNMLSKHPEMVQEAIRRMGFPKDDPRDLSREEALELVTAALPELSVAEVSMPYRHDPENDPHFKVEGAFVSYSSVLQGDLKVNMQREKYENVHGSTNSRDNHPSVSSVTSWYFRVAMLVAGYPARNAGMLTQAVMRLLHRHASFEELKEQAEQEVQAGEKVSDDTAGFKARMAELRSRTAPAMGQQAQTVNGSSPASSAEEALTDEQWKERIQQALIRELIPSFKGNREAAQDPRAWIGFLQANFGGKAPNHVIKKVAVEVEAAVQKKFNSTAQEA